MYAEVVYITMSETCPATKLLNLLSKRHMLLVIYHLSQRAHGFNELQEKLSLNTATLSRRLKELEEEGFVEKKRKGLHRCYSLSKRGKQLSDLIGKISKI